MIKILNLGGTVRQIIDIFIVYDFVKRDGDHRGFWIFDDEVRYILLNIWKNKNTSLKRSKFSKVRLHYVNKLMKYLPLVWYTTKLLKSKINYLTMLKSI